MILVSIGGPGIVGEGLGSIRGMSALQMFLWVFVLASIAEEFLFRGLMQGLLAPLSSYGIQLPKTHLTVPVILPALAFGLGHLLLLGSTAVPLVITIVISTTLLGLVAGRYREKTGSIVPAIVVHMMFNVPGILGKLGSPPGA
jgi:membrane protease YdiL (CAAX protease family)